MVVPLLWQDRNAIRVPSSETSLQSLSFIHGFMKFWKASERVTFEQLTKWLISFNLLLENRCDDDVSKFSWYRSFLAKAFGKAFYLGRTIKKLFVFFFKLLFRLFFDPRMELLLHTSMPFSLYRLRNASELYYTTHHSIEAWGWYLGTQNNFRFDGLKSPLAYCTE